MPIVGEKFDGHEFAEQVLASGAGAALWQRDRQPVPNLPLILVEDTLAALQLLASAYLSENSAKVVGITGSNGKTTVKDMVSALLETTYKVHKTQGNYNNHIGLPLTVLSMKEETEVIVLEMGMSGVMKSNCSLHSPIRMLLSLRTLGKHICCNSVRVRKSLARNLRLLAE